VFDNPILPHPMPHGWDLYSHDVSQFKASDANSEYSIWKVHLLSDGDVGLATITWGIMIPDWILIALFASATVIPWLPLLPVTFSLRTLLIATTLIAVALGLIVWASS
jgi:hypothetical protein